MNWWAVGHIVVGGMAGFFVAGAITFALLFRDWWRAVRLTLSATILLIAWGLIVYIVGRLAANGGIG